MCQAIQNNIIGATLQTTRTLELLNLLCSETEESLPGSSAGVISLTPSGEFSLLAGPHLPCAAARPIPQTLGPGQGRCPARMAVEGKTTVFIDDLTTNGRCLHPCAGCLIGQNFQSGLFSPFYSSDNSVLGLIAIFSTLTGRPNEHQQRIISTMSRLCALMMGRDTTFTGIQQQANYDSLTGLPNRRFIHTYGEKILEDVRSHGQGAALLLLNMDRFKRINSSVGHKAGDTVLHTLACRLKSRFEDRCLVGRLDGDEFLLLAPYAGVAEAVALAREAQTEVARTLHIKDITLNVSCRAGISIFPEDGCDIETLLRNAALALLQVGISDIEHCSLFNRVLGQHARLQLKMESALREAVDTQEIRLHYQPQVDLFTGQLRGVEALARWVSPIFGKVRPSEFIPLAEHSGIIHKLTQRVIRESCAQLKKWREQGLPISLVSINLSSLSFHNQDLTGFLLDNVRHYGLNPENLLLELTEGVLLDPHPEVMKTVHHTAAAGFKFSLDDFGTGYSSLSYLRKLPISELKLDRSFTMDLHDSEKSRRLSRAVLGIGSSLGLEVVAEGIERVSQLEVLRKQGYTIGQGFLFGQGMPPEDLAVWMRGVSPAQRLEESEEACVFEAGDG